MPVGDLVDGAAWQGWYVDIREAAREIPVCLALANTREWRRAATPVETLNAFGDVIAFGREVLLLDAQAAERIGARAQQQPQGAAHELAAVLRLREAVYDVFSARAHGREPQHGSAAILIEGFEAALASLSFELRDRHLVTLPRHDPDALDGVRLQCALSAAALLGSRWDRKVKVCADDRGCGRLFLDVTRNGTRRFCRSRACGNRARQAAFRARHRATRAEDASA